MLPKKKSKSTWVISIKCPVCGAVLKVDDKERYYCGECSYKEEHEDEKDRVFGKIQSQFSKKKPKLPKSPYNDIPAWEISK